MDPIFLSPASASASQYVPIVVADRRPTADAAALARDPQPSLPLTMAPTPVSGLSQTTAVVRSNVAASTERLELGNDAAQEVDRTLLPYGVKMLPDGKTDRPSLFAEPSEEQGQTAPEAEDATEPELAA